MPVSDRAAELGAALQNATDAPAILDALARAVWFNAHDGAECPTDRMPTLADMGAALLPIDAVQEAVARSSAAVGIEPPLRLMTTTGGAPDGAAAPFTVPGGMAEYWAWLPVRTARPDLAPAPDPERPGDAIEAVHAAWLAHPDCPNLHHPLAPLVAAWQQRPQAEPMVDDDRPRIMPRTVAHIEHNAESYYLARFGPAVHHDANGQLSLGFTEEGERGPTLPANVWTMGLGEAEKRGAVVPLALRIWIAAVLHTPMHARHGNYPILLNSIGRIGPDAAALPAMGLPRS